ncbi:hypothetical protein [Larkinella sp. C7]|uniref:hypothetical protein n=1 Tax=Larkinella sp. C7 TaxID=2576607 RepID=UPI0011115B54|nr:hypothetical protein [Larkinella sp. C7]
MILVTRQRSSVHVFYRQRQRLQNPAHSRQHIGFGILTIDRLDADVAARNRRVAVDRHQSASRPAGVDSRYFVRIDPVRAFLQTRKNCRAVG